MSTKLILEIEYILKLFLMINGGGRDRFYILVPISFRVAADPLKLHRKDGKRILLILLLAAIVQ